MAHLAKRLLATYKRTVQRFVKPSLRSQPESAVAWVVHARHILPALPEQTRTLIKHHDLHQGGHAITYCENDIVKEAGEKLRQLASNPDAGGTAAAIEEIVRWLTVKQCAQAHSEGLYFAHAESHMAKQWNDIIWSIIKDADFAHTVELACGHGRNTEFLRRLAKTVDLVDVNQSCIEACRQRFGSEKDGCSFRYHVTSGNVLPVGDATMTFGYSWDSMVHFDKLVVQDYVREFARVLKSGGTAFLHHSNYGAVAPDSSWTKNHGNRSDMTAELMRDYAQQSGLTIKFQRLSGTADGWGIDRLDCLSLLQKPH